MFINKWNQEYFQTIMRIWSILLIKSDLNGVYILEELPFHIRTFGVLILMKFYFIFFEIILAFSS